MKKKIKRNIIISTIGISLLAAPLISLVALIGNDTENKKNINNEANGIFASNNSKTQKNLHQSILEEMAKPSGLIDQEVPENKIYSSIPSGVKISLPDEIKPEDIETFAVTNSDVELGTTKIAVLLKSGAAKTFEVSGFKPKKSHNDLLNKIPTLKEVVLGANKNQVSPGIGLYDNLLSANINIINWPKEIDINQIKELFVVNSNKENGTISIRISLYDGQEELFNINGFLSLNDLHKELQEQLNSSQFYGDSKTNSLENSNGLIYINSNNSFPKEISITWLGALSTKDIISYSITKSNPIQGSINLLINLKSGASRSLTINGFQKQENVKKIEQNVLDVISAPSGTLDVPVLENGQYSKKPFGLNVQLPQRFTNSVQYYEVKNSNYNNGTLNLTIQLKSGAKRTFLVQGFQNIDKIKLLEENQQILLDSAIIKGDNNFTIPEDAIYTNIPTGINVIWPKGIGWLDIKEVIISNSNEVTSTISLEIKLKSGANKKWNDISGFITTKNYQQKLLERLNINGKGIILENTSSIILDVDNIFPNKSLIIGWIGNLSKDDILSYSISNSNADLGSLTLTIILKSQASKTFIVQGFNTTSQLEKNILSKAKFSPKDANTLILPNTEGLIIINDSTIFPDAINISWPDGNLSNDNIASYQIRRSGDIIKDRINLTIYLKSGASRNVDIFGFSTLGTIIKKLFDNESYKAEVFAADNNILAPFIDSTPVNWYVIPTGIKINWNKLNKELPNYNINNKAILSYQVIKSNITLGTATILLNILGANISIDLDGFLNYGDYKQAQQKLIDEKKISFSIKPDSNIDVTEGLVKLNSINLFPENIELHFDSITNTTISKTNIVSYSINKTDIENHFTLVVNLRSKASGTFTIIASPILVETVVENNVSIF